MKNKELIRRLISFDDESGVDTSTGFVNVGHTAGDLYWKVSSARPFQPLDDGDFWTACMSNLPKSSMTYTGLSRDKSFVGINIHKYISHRDIGIDAYFEKQSVCVSLVIPTMEIDSEVYVSYDDFVNVVENVDIPHVVTESFLSRLSIKYAIMNDVIRMLNYKHEGTDDNVKRDTERLMTEILNEKIIPMFLRLRDKLLKIIKTKMKEYCISLK